MFERLETCTSACGLHFFSPHIEVFIEASEAKWKQACFILFFCSLSFAVFLLLKRELQAYDLKFCVALFCRWQMRHTVLCFVSIAQPSAP